MATVSAENFALFGRMLALVELIEPAILQVGRVIFRFFPGGKITPLTNEELEREFSKEIKAKTSTFNDGTHVIKVRDAIKCVEKNFSDTTLIAEFVKAAIKDLIAGKMVVAPAQGLVDAIAECIREDCLRQDTPRTLVTERAYHRPARGHGKGRRTFG